MASSWMKRLATLKRLSGEGKSIRDIPDIMKQQHGLTISHGTVYRCPDTNGGRSMHRRFLRVTRTIESQA
jgi:hypothetical protein